MASIFRKVCLTKEIVWQKTYYGSTVARVHKTRWKTFFFSGKKLGAYYIYFYHLFIMNKKLYERFKTEACKVQRF